MNRLIKRQLQIALLVSLFLPLTTFALSGEMIEGKVLEEGTSKPIAGAIVAVRWTGNVPAFAESRSVCVHVDTTTTDTNGNYRFPRWHASSTVGPIVQDLRAATIAYKPTYEHARGIRGIKEKTVYLKSFIGMKKERLRYLQHIVVSCHEAGESKKNLLPLAKALYEEALSLAETEDEKKIVDKLLFNLEIIELGYETAERRQIDRSRGQK